MPVSVSPQGLEHSMVSLVLERELEIAKVTFIGRCSQYATSKGGVACLGCIPESQGRE